MSAPESHTDSTPEENAGEDSDFALRLQLQEYEELENSLPPGLRPDESDLQARLALLRDIAQGQFYAMQQQSVEEMLGHAMGQMGQMEAMAPEGDAHEMHQDVVMDDDGDDDYEDVDEDEDDMMIEINTTNLHEVLSRLRSHPRLGGMQLAQLMQAISMTTQQEVDVDNMSYEELTDLCDSIGKVNIGLKPDEITARTLHFTYGKQLRVSADEKCPICMCEFAPEEELRKLTCPHYFHADCIATWLAESKKCPVCKEEVGMEPTPLCPTLAPTPDKRKEKTKKKKVAGPSGSPGVSTPKEREKEKGAKKKKAVQTPPADGAAAPSGKPKKKKKTSGAAAGGGAGPMMLR